jgi:hypothetical protein
MLFAAAALIAAAPLVAQTVAIEGGTVHTMAGAPIENATVLIRDGKVVAVGTNVQVPAGAQRVDARGKIVTPGFFASGSRIGLTEVGAVPGTNDYAMREDDQIAAAFNVAEGLNPRSIVIPVNRIAGITTAVAEPAGGLISGQGVVIDLAGERVEELLVRTPVAMFATLGERSQGAGGGARAGVATAEAPAPAGNLGRLASVPKHPTRLQVVIPFQGTQSTRLVHRTLHGKSGKL